MYEIKKIGVENNKIENSKTLKKINETKNGLFEKANKMDKFLARVTKKSERRHKPPKSEMKEETSL